MRAPLYSYIFLPIPMPSQPDLARAAILNPDKFKTDPREQVAALEMQCSYLADELSKHTKESRAEILRNSAIAVSGGAIPDRAKGKKKAGESDATAKFERDRAQFFAHKERAEFVPIALRDEPPYKGMKEESFRYFENEEEAISNGFTAAKIGEQTPAK